MIGDVGTSLKSYRNIKKLLDLLGIRYEELGSKHESSRICNQFMEKKEREKQIAEKWIEKV
jgi:reverse gyrase